MNQDLYTKMTTSKIKPLLLRMSIPTVISMLVTSIYNMADTYFVSKIDTSATAAISVVFSLQSLIQAFGFTLGMGCGSTIAMLLGNKEKEKANEVASSTMVFGFIIGLLLLVFGLLFTDKIVLLLGATTTAAPYAASYAKYIFIATPMMMISFIMNNTLRSEGHAIYSMCGLGLGSLLNIGLDPLFMFSFNMGIDGAGLSTMVSQIISTCVLFSMFIFKKSETRLSFAKISKDPMLYLKVVKLGSPTLFRQGCASASNIVLNFLAKPFGDPCLAALGVTTKIYQFMRSLIIGFGQAFQPILGYNYGAKKNDRIKEAFTFTLAIDTSLCLIATVLVLAFPGQIIAFFRDDPEVIAIGINAIRYLAIAFPLLGFSTIVNQCLQVTGFSKSAALLASLRQGIIFIPLIYLLSYLFGVTGICLTQPISDLLTSLISFPFLIFFFKRLKENK